jgi:hypothetical protein
MSIVLEQIGPTILVYEDLSQGAARPKTVRQIQDCTECNLLGDLVTRLWPRVTARLAGSPQFGSERRLPMLTGTKITSS